MSGPSNFDLIVVGAGAGGLVSALAASCKGAKVAVLERASVLGGTCAISGGQIWSPLNQLMENDGEPDSVDEALEYLSRVTLGEVNCARLSSYLMKSPFLLAFLESRTALKFFRLARPDYHPAFPGARDGRSFEPYPFDTKRLGAWKSLIRVSPIRLPVTSIEAKEGISSDIIADRQAGGIRTQGGALVAGLIQGCIDQGVEFHLNERVVDLLLRDGEVVGCETMSSSSSKQFYADCGVVLASGGFEWNSVLKSAFLSPPDQAPTSPPWNEGDGLMIGMKLGAGVDHMTESWWTAAINIPGEIFEGQHLYRNIVRELALPGSLLINHAGVRFVNEASSYHDLGKAFQAFDAKSYEFKNIFAWLIFDERFKRKYQILTISPFDAAPPWFFVGSTVADLAEKIGVPATTLMETVATFNAYALAGVDKAFGRGSDRHGIFYGDPSHGPNPCLAPLVKTPYYAIPILFGNNGTKGGLMTDEDSRVIRFDGSVIAGLYACGNVAASVMGPGYPGTGGSLGPLMTEAMHLGQRAIEIGFGSRREGSHAKV